MKKYISIVVSFTMVLGITNLIAASTTSPTQTDSISGYIRNGYRILEIPDDTDTLNLTVYRGDYIKFAFEPSQGDRLLRIPDLSIEQVLVKDQGEAPYFKMKHTGGYLFSLGNSSGTITVIEYRQGNYKATSSTEAAELIADGKPFILDVRTPAEFKRGHLKNAVLIPVQELQNRIHEVSRYQNRDVLIYCATGNRSTVASKLLIDKGFKSIFNLRYGIYEWSKKNYPITK